MTDLGYEASLFRLISRHTTYYSTAATRYRNYFWKIPERLICGHTIRFWPFFDIGMLIIRRFVAEIFIVALLELLHIKWWYSRILFAFTKIRFLYQPVESRYIDKSLFCGTLEFKLLKQRSIKETILNFHLFVMRAIPCLHWRLASFSPDS